MRRPDLLDLLFDLQHDLGKYVRLPLSMLPRDAGAEAVRGALESALHRTRQGPRGVRSARMLWRAFLEEGGEAVASLGTYATLASAVERALAWERSLLPGAPAIDRASLESDLAAVGAAIRALIEEVRREP